jgi:hypothetical protein
LIKGDIDANDGLLLLLLLLLLQVRQVRNATFIALALETSLNAKA